MVIRRTQTKRKNKLLQVKFASSIKVGESTPEYLYFVHFTDFFSKKLFVLNFTRWAKAVVYGAHILCMQYGACLKKKTVIPWLKKA